MKGDGRVSEVLFYVGLFVALCLGVAIGNTLSVIQDEVQSDAPVDLPSEDLVETVGSADVEGICTDDGRCILISADGRSWYTERVSG